MYKHKIIELSSWFNNQYRIYCEMLTRREYLGIEDKIIDDVRHKEYTSLQELYEEAELVAKELKEYKKLMNNL